MTDSRTAAINALDVEARIGTTYPAPFRKEVAARSKRVLGDLFGLTNYGVNLVELAPGAWSAQRHWHTREDEFVYVLSGELTLVSDEGRHVLIPGMVAGFPAGESNGHHLINTGDSDASYLEIGDRISADEVFYPDIDLQLVADGKGERVFTHRDGKPYDVE
jgi:uncharacterized cupin superfamily protein